MSTIVPPGLNFTKHGEGGDNRSPDDNFFLTGDWDANSEGMTWNNWYRQRNGLLYRLLDFYGCLRVFYGFCYFLIGLFLGVCPYVCCCHQRLSPLPARQVTYSTVLTIILWRDRVDVPSECTIVETTRRAPTLGSKT